MMPKEIVMLFCSLKWGCGLRKLRNKAITSAILWPLAQGDVTFAVMWAD